MLFGVTCCPITQLVGRVIFGRKDCMNKATDVGFSPVGTLLGAKDFVLDLISLTKPRVMSLLLVSTCCPLVLAAGGTVSMGTVLWLLLGGALITGSAHAVNCIWDRDIDAMMERTKSRPLASGRISVLTASLFSFTIGTLGLLVLALRLNVHAAAAALVGHLFYSIVYTIWLKRSTPQNIVIGGAAGALPPIVGWVAATGSINLTAFLIFMVVFLWTPPHFWALALNKNDDYKRAGIPMMPVVAGKAATHNQMLFYALALIPVTLLLVLSDPYLGSFSLVVLLGIGVVFAYKNYELKCIGVSDAKAHTKKAWDVFGFSLIYLSLFFACLVVDSTLL